MSPIYLDPAQHTQLKRLSESTRVPMQVYLREAVDDLLKKYPSRRPRTNALRPDDDPANADWLKRKKR